MEPVCPRIAVDGSQFGPEESRQNLAEHLGDRGGCRLAAMKGVSDARTPLLLQSEEFPDATQDCPLRFLHSLAKSFFTSLLTHRLQFDPATRQRSR